MAPECLRRTQLSEVGWQSIPHSWSGDTECSVSELPMCLRHQKQATKVFKTSKQWQLTAVTYTTYQNFSQRWPVSDLLNAVAKLQPAKAEPDVTQLAHGKAAANAVVSSTLLLALCAQSGCDIALWTATPSFWLGDNVTAFAAVDTVTVRTFLLTMTVKSLSKFRASFLITTAWKLCSCSLSPVNMLLNGWSAVSFKRTYTTQHNPNTLHTTTAKDNQKYSLI